ncbi:rhomboid family intramembrane serine protease [uncultured Gimesia sp.]|uniref:rhomboid family intramembrane serine protease n=1 Tax=uncultured Gimesia sp. TaxID=1678688 RepID=UPI0026238E5D|nr:rhomboid family intramembrane serine protease [uncultured Gimesia sp.]
MRKIGSFPSEQQAKRFVDYMLTQGISINVEPAIDLWTIWVYDEDQVDQSKTALDEFLANPEADKYQGVTRQAEAIREEKIKKAVEASRKQVNVRDTWNQPFTSRCPVTSFLIGISIVVFLFMQSDEYNVKVREALSICSFQVSGNMISYDRRLVEVREGEVWRLVTPIFIHFSIFHILFNCMMAYQLGGAIEMNRGSMRLALLVLVTAIPSNLAQFYWGGPGFSMGGPGFGGLSGVVYGMFGYMWMKSLYDPQAGFYVPPNMVFILIGWFFLCMTGMVGPIANLAHGFGLGTGMALGVGSTFLRQAGKSK